MKRRRFLQFLGAAPAAAALPKLAQAAEPYAGIASRTLDKMAELLVEAAEKAVNPPMIVTETGAFLPLGVGPDWAQVYRLEAMRKVSKNIDDEILRNLHYGDRP